MTGGIAISNSVRITSGSAPTTLINNVKSSDAITIEAWVKPANTSQDGPARIVSISQDGSNRNASLMQDGTRYEARIRTSDNNDNGTSPNIRSNANQVQTVMQHVVFVYNPSDGKGRIYLNGSQIKSTNNVGGNLDNWSNSFQMIIGNEFGDNLDDRDWRGEIYTIAIYSKALSTSEITQNYNAGEA